MTEPAMQPPASPVASIIRFLIERKVLVFAVLAMLVGGGILVAPFDWLPGNPLRRPVPVDALPDIGENQQIVFTEWPGRSPKDVEDQITYPLATALLGIPQVKTIRSVSMFGFSSVYVIFRDNADFYWSRSRILEKLNSLPVGTLPAAVQPQLGPDATGMGQVFWYTLEGLDEKGRPAGGWDLHELRSIQDWQVRYALTSVEGVSEVASAGGFVQEYQVDLDPDRMRINGVSLEEVVAAVKAANLDVGAQTIEVNRVEYVIRGIGFIRGLQDLEDAVVKINGDLPVFIRTVARVGLGPEARQGALVRNGAEAVGGVIAVRYGENPLRVIQDIKRRIHEISEGLPRKTLADGSVSRVQIVPFYDRTRLIQETLNTLENALFFEMLVTVLIIMISLAYLRNSLMVSGTLPVAVLMCFIAMKVFGVEANLLALSGIAIAIGTIDDMGIILVENIHRHLEKSPPDANRLDVIVSASAEVGGAIVTAISTTLISFLPVFFLEGAEGKLFKPLAITKTLALFASFVAALGFIPPLAHLLNRGGREGRRKAALISEGLIFAGAAAAFLWEWRIGLLTALVGACLLVLHRIPPAYRPAGQLISKWTVIAGTTVLLALLWTPLGPGRGVLRNLIFVVLIFGGCLAVFHQFQRFYERILRWCLAHKALFLAAPALMVICGATVWQGYGTLFGWLPRLINEGAVGRSLARAFPGLGREFMPSFDEGASLFMPTTMPHASIGEVMDILLRQDQAILSVPEVELAVGKLGRARTALDPAPVNMIETVINYRPEYLSDERGRMQRFRSRGDETDLFRDESGAPVAAADGRPYRVKGKYLRDEQNRLMPDPRGEPFRLWRPPLDAAINPGRSPWAGIRGPEDIWRAITEAARIPGTTSAAELQPISARMVMLQSGIRAAMGIKVRGPDLPSIQQASMQIETYLREVTAIDPQTVIADRVIGKPYLEVRIDRRAAARYGIKVQQVLDVLEYAVGGARITTTVEGRERYPVRVRYSRELRDELESIGRILVPAPDGTQLPLSQLAEIVYVRGPMEIKGDNGFTVGYVLFDGRKGMTEADVIAAAGERCGRRKP